MADQNCLKIGGWRPLGVIGFADCHAHARAQLSAFNWQKNAAILVLGPLFFCFGTAASPRHRIPRPPVGGWKWLPAPGWQLAMARRRNESHLCRKDVSIL